MSPDRSDDPPDEELIEAIERADGLAVLAAVVDADSDHEAYVRAKEIWRERPVDPPETIGPPPGLPGERVVVDGNEFWVHGITHADTEAERSFLRSHVDRLLEADATIYCEQGIRGMYFQDRTPVCEMDDYRWAMEECDRMRAAEADPSTGAESSHHGERDRWSVEEPQFEGFSEEIAAFTSEVKDAAFELIDFGRDRYGEDVAAALGDVATQFLGTHTDLATGEDYESFRLTRAAAEDPERLSELQTYYKRTFLPQPIEREWLRRHDRELEIVTHARNERMADYAVYHNDDAPQVHLIVGAAHGPGVRYYLEEHRDGTRSIDGFDIV